MGPHLYAMFPIFFCYHRNDNSTILTLPFFLKPSMGQTHLYPSSSPFEIKEFFKPLVFHFFKLVSPAMGAGARSSVNGADSPFRTEESILG